MLWLEQEIDDPGHPPRKSMRRRLHNLEGAQSLMVELAKVRRSQRRELVAWLTVLAAIIGFILDHLHFG